MKGTSPDPDDQSSDSTDAGSSASRWAAPESLEPSPALLQRIGYLTPAPRQDCVLVGPSGAGKSGLLSALGRTSRAEIQGGIRLSLFPGEALTRLAGARSKAAAAGALDPTEEPAAYDFQAEIEGLPSGSPLHAEVVVQELPGREVFGPPGGDPPLKRSARAQLWLHGARRASCLVLCVDSMRPDRLRWEVMLPQLIGSLADSSGRLVDRLSWAGQRDPVLSPKRQLPYARILVLLTKIDQLCAVAATRLEKGLPLLANLARSPRDLASQLDPISLVRDILGQPFLDQLSAAAAPEARMAVGLTWAPFGVLESVLFMVAGEARYPLERLTPSAFPQQHPREILLHFGGHR